MKKVCFMFSLLFVMLFSYKAQGQELNLEEYKTEESSSVSKSELLQKYPKLSESETYKNAEILVLKNGLELLKWDNSIGLFTYDYAVYNRDSSQMVYFHTKIEKNKSIEVYDSNSELLYTVQNNNGNEVFRVNSQLSTGGCFRDCMEESEEAVVDGFLGWAAWNLSPGVQIAAAIRCEWIC